MSIDQSNFCTIINYEINPSYMKWRKDEMVKYYREKVDKGQELWKQYGSGAHRWSLRDLEDGPCHWFWNSFTKRYRLDDIEPDQSPSIWLFPPGSNIPIHRDPDSLGWIGIKLIGDQPLEFFDSDKNKLFEVQYDAICVDSQQPHRANVQGKERVLLRKAFMKTPYGEVVGRFK